MRVKNEVSSVKVKRGWTLIMFNSMNFKKERGLVVIHGKRDIKKLSRLRTCLIYPDGKKAWNDKTSSLIVCKTADYEKKYRFKLEGLTNPVYRYYDENSGKHFWTARPKEESKDFNELYKLAGISFYASESGIPVHRFYNKNTGKHFWTIDPKNEDLKGYEEEGIAFYTPKNGIPVYRFLNKTTGQHYWTSNPPVEDLPGYNEEAIAFYGLSD